MFRHKATGMTHQEFGAFAEKVGKARNATLPMENTLRAQGKHEEANALYAKSKANTKSILDAHKVTPKAFDSHMKDYAKAAGTRAPNVKMSRVFSGQDTSVLGPQGLRSEARIPQTSSKHPTS